MQKATGSISAALLSFALVAVGFVPGATSQTATAGQGVKFLMTIGSSIFAIIIIVFMIFYPLSKAKMIEISKQIGRGNGSENEREKA